LHRQLAPRYNARANVQKTVAHSEPSAVHPSQDAGNNSAAAVEGPRADVNDQKDWVVNDWQAQPRAASCPAWKQALHAASRRGIDLLVRRRLSRAARVRWKPDWVSFGRGFPFEFRIRWGLAGLDLHKAVLLIQGVGTGWEIPLYAQLRPARLIATDMCSFETWAAIADHCDKQFGVKVEFLQTKLEEHSFLDAGSVDACISHGVFEHCRDLATVLRESRRVLRRGGRLFAAFGPLWYGAGGDHFSTRGGLEHAYAHVDRDPAAYRAFFEAHRKPYDDFQSGGRYVELDLFSKLSADQYFEHFASAGFTQTGLIVYLQSLAFQFEREFPQRWAKLLADLRGRADADELRLAGLVIRATAL
jgi:SAM-dependent methyltransferase